MKKKITINDRPMIVVSSSTQEWAIKEDPRTKKLYLTKKNGETLNAKKETLTTGVFRCNGGRWGYDIITRKGETMDPYHYSKDPEPADFSSVKQIFSTLRKAKKDFTTGFYYIKRILYSYTNSKTKETTKDLEVAKSWFKGENPLWIAQNSRQTVGVWVEGKNDHVEISFYYNNSLTKNQIDKWTCPEKTGVYLYPDGTISHFWKGKYDKDKIFVTKRQSYQSFDYRFIDLTTSQYNLVDLRSKDLTFRGYRITSLSKATLAALKKAGFPTNYWYYGEQQYPIERTYDLINFIKSKQVAKVGKRQEGLSDFLADKPFDIQKPESCIEEYKDGLVLRLPETFVIYTDKTGRTSDHPWRLTEPTMVKEFGAREKFRIWIKHNGKAASVSELIHNNKEWTISNLNRAQCISLDDHDHHNTSVWKETQTHEFEKIITQCQRVNSILCDTLMDKLRFIKYYKEFIEASSYSLKVVLSFIQIYLKAPTLIDTLIKTGNGTILQSKYYYTSNMRYSLEKVFDLFAVSNGYKERKGSKLWHNLGISKEQYKFGLENREKAQRIFLMLKTIAIPMPVKTGVPMFDETKHYAPGDVVQKENLMFTYNSEKEWSLVTYPQKEGRTILSSIPFKYIELINNILMFDENNRIYDIERLLKSSKVSFKDLEVLYKRKINFSLLSDYWGLLSNINWYTRRDDDENIGWELFPKTPDELKQLHDEARIRLDLAREEYRAEQEMRREEQEKNNTAKYAKLLKKLGEFQMENDRFTVVIPQKLSEIVDEGANMRHCVGSYTQRVADGETFVFFLREKTNINQCFVTFNINPATNKIHRNRDGSVTLSTHKWCMDQAFAKCDQKPSKEAIDFIKEWAKAKDVDFSTIMKACI